MSEKRKLSKVRRGIARIISGIVKYGLGEQLLTEDGLQKALNRREAEVRNLVAESVIADGLAESKILEEVENFYNLKAALDERSIPERFVQFAESLGITSENTEALDLFESLIWKDRQKEKDEKTVKESSNWISTAQYVGVASQRLMTEDMRRIIKDFTFYWFEKSPGFRGGLRELRRYVIGKGSDFTIPIPEISKLWKEFWKYNRLEKRHKKLFEYALMCGEITLIVRKDDRGKWFLSNIPYFEQDFESAVVTAPEDRDKVIAIGRRMLQSETVIDYEYYGMADDPDHQSFPDDLKDNNNTPIKPKDDSYAIYMVFNGFADEKRGRPSFHAALKYNKILDDFVLNRARLNDFRSRIMMVRTKTEAASKDTGGKYKPIPPGGVILTENNTIKYRWEAPKIEAGDAYNDGKLFMYLVCAAIEVPPHIAFQNAENSNYNSIKEADTPFTQVVLDWQDDWKEIYESIFYTMLPIWIDEGLLNESYKVKMRDDETGLEVLKDQITIECPFAVGFPDIVTKNVKDKNDETTTLMDHGVLSKKGASIRHNLDYDSEQAQIQKEKEQEKADQANSMKDWQNGKGLLPNTKFPDSIPLPDTTPGA